MKITTFMLGLCQLYIVRQTHDLSSITVTWQPHFKKSHRQVFWNTPSGFFKLNEALKLLTKVLFALEVSAFKFSPPRESRNKIWCL